MATNLVTVAPGQKVFKTKSGKTYHIEVNTVSLPRFAMWQEYDLQFNFNLTGKELFMTFKEIFEHARRSDCASIGVISHDRMNRYQFVEKRIIPAVEFCTLVINEENEDRTIFDPDIMEAKKKDWADSGIDIGFFLHVAGLLADRLEKDYEKSIQNTLASLKQLNEPNQQQTSLL